MEEIPLFYWDDSIRSSESPLVLQGNGELQLQDVQGGCGRGDPSDPNELFLWRTLPSSEIDIGLASLCDARSSKWRRFKPSAALVKNGVLASKSFVGVVTGSGDIFRIAGSPFSSQNSSTSVVSNVQFTPTACCWTRVRSLNICWLGSDQGEVHCMAFRENGGIEFSGKVELPSKPSSWLRAFARFQKRPVLALFPTESVHGEQNQVCALFSDGSLLTINLQIAINQHHLELSQPLQLFDENVSWISGEIFAVKGGASGQFLVQATKQYRDKPVASIWMVSLNADGTLQNAEGEEVVLDDDLAGYTPCGVVRPNDDGPVLVLRSPVNSKTLFRTFPSLQAPTNVISEFDVDFGFLKHPSSSLRPVIEKLSAHFTLNGLNHILHRTFLSKSNHVEEAISKFASLGSSNDRTVFLDLLKTNVKNYWDDEQSILFVSSSSFVNGLIVRKRGLSILIPKDSASRSLVVHSLIMGESSLPHVVTRGAQKAINQILHTDCESLSLDVVQDLAMDHYPENQVFEDLAGKFGDARNFIELAETMTRKYVDIDHAIAMMGNDGSTINAVMLTELLRKRAAELVVECLTLVVAFSVVRHHFFSENDLVLNVVSRCNFLLVQEARKAGLVLRLVSALNASRSESRLQEIGPLHKVTCSFFPGCNVTVPLREDTVIFTELEDEEESNPIWAWASEFRYGQGSNLSAWGNPIWARIKRAVFHRFAPWNLRSGTNTSSFTWTVLSRCQDFAELKLICEGLSEGGYAQVDDARITSLLEGCVHLWEFRNRDSGANKTELLGRAKEAFIHGAPILSAQSTYFENVAKLFQGISPSLLLEVLRLARLTSEQEEDTNLVIQLFKAALDSREFEEALGYLLEIENAAGRNELATELVQAILDNHAFRALLTLPFENHTDVLESAMAVVKKQTNQEASLSNEKTFRVFYAFFMRHSYHGAAADLAFRKAWLDELEVNRKYQSEQNALQLCLAAAAHQPNDMYVGSTTVERGNNELNHEFHYEKDVVRRLAKARVQSAFIIALRSYKYKMGNIPDDPCALFRTVVGWLRQNRNNLRGVQDELLLALYELCTTWQLSIKDWTDYFQTVGELYQANTQLLDGFVRSLFLVQMDGLATQQIRGAKCILEKVLEHRQVPETWWVDMLRRIKGLAMYVELLSEYGFWLRATCLAIELVPDTLDISKPAQLPVNVLEKILSRSKRFKPTSNESVHVLDILDDASFHSLKTGADELERKLKRYFGIIQNHRDLLLGGLART